MERQQAIRDIVLKRDIARYSKFIRSPVLISEKD